MNMHSPSTRLGRDKVALFNWDAVKGHGEFQSIDKNLLRVDRCYQRDFSNVKSLEISKKFNWIAFGALVVARRPDGSLYIVDGQHRHGAALKRSDISHVPCIVYDAPAVGDEAEGFLEINVGRKSLTAFDRHRALLMQGDEVSLLIEKLAAENGFSVDRNNKPNGIRCLAACKTLLQTKRESFLEVFPLAAELCRDRIFDERVIAALVYVQDVTGGQITSALWRRAVLDIGYAKIRSAIDRASVFYERGGAKVWASGLVEVLNKGRRSNKLSLGSETGCE
jgi:hypothetical protein